MRRAGALALVLASLGVALPQPAAAAAPVPLGPRQVSALRALSGYVTRLVAMTRTIGEGVEVPEAQIRTLRRSFARWNAANRAVLGARLATPRTLGRRGVTVLDAIETVETRGGASANERVRAAVAAFNATAVAFGRMRFTTSARG